jgi:hypothetical protein
LVGDFQQNISVARLAERAPARQVFPAEQFFRFSRRLTSRLLNPHAVGFHGFGGRRAAKKVVRTLSSRSAAAMRQAYFP